MEETAYYIHMIVQYKRKHEKINQEDTTKTNESVAHIQKTGSEKFKPEHPYFHHQSKPITLGKVYMWVWKFPVS